MTEPLDYHYGFGNTFDSEALPGALPVGQFSPQKLAYGLYAEKFTATAFTAPRAQNRRSWFYRIQPSVVQGEFERIDRGLLRTGPIDESPPTPNQLRWDPFDVPDSAQDFVDGLVTLAANGDVAWSSYLRLSVIYWMVKFVGGSWYVCK